MIRIHITGAPRSGTTLLQSLMGACFTGINAPQGETRAWDKVPREGIVCTKNPNDTLLAPLLLALDARLHVVCMIRDPRDVISSRHYSAPDKYFTNLRVWREHTDIIRRLKNHPRFHVVRYEDLVQDPDRVQATLAAEMTFLARKRPFSTYEGEGADNVETEALNGVRAVEASKIGNWKDHKGRIKAQMALHGGLDAELVEFGFEKSSGWDEDLPYIESDTAPSLTPETLPPARRASRAINRWLHAGAYLRRKWLGF